MGASPKRPSQLRLVCGRDELALDQHRTKRMIVMVRMVIAVALALAATASYAQVTTPSTTSPTVSPSTAEAKPFLFDGRMKGDGARKGAFADVRQPSPSAPVDRAKPNQIAR